MKGKKRKEKLLYYMGITVLNEYIEQNPKTDFAGLVFTWINNLKYKKKYVKYRSQRIISLMSNKLKDNRRLCTKQKKHCVSLLN